MASKKTKQIKPVAVVEEPVSGLLKELLAQDVSREELLACGVHRDTGVLARMSRRELQELVPETDGKGMEHSTVLMLARYPVERAMLAKNGATPERLAEFDKKAAATSRRIFETHAATQAAKTVVSAQRRATTMNDAPATETTTKKATKKAATKKAAAKEAKAPAGRKANTDVYETMVVATSKETREGTFFDTVMKAAAKPIKLETLITKVGKDVELRSGKDANSVIRTRVRDAFTRLGYLKAAKA